MRIIRTGDTLSEVLCELRKIRDGGCGVDAVSDVTKRLGGIIGKSRGQA